MQQESKKRRSGWTDERRARQAEAIRRWAPWTRSTGPRTPEGKRVSSRNAVLTGARAEVAAIRVQAGASLRELARLMREIERLKTRRAVRAASPMERLMRREAERLGEDVAARYLQALRG